eukprot:Sro467_g148930.3  (451) ;mRNA; f:32761-34113
MPTLDSQPGLATTKLDRGSEPMHVTVTVSPRSSPIHQPTSSPKRGPVLVSSSQGPTVHDASPLLAGDQPVMVSRAVAPTAWPKHASKESSKSNKWSQKPSLSSAEKVSSPELLEDVSSPINASVVVSPKIATKRLEVSPKHSHRSANDSAISPNHSPRGSLPLSNDTSVSDDIEVYHSAIQQVQEDVALSPKPLPKYVKKAEREKPKDAKQKLFEQNVLASADQKDRAVSVSVTLSPTSSPKHAHKAARFSPKLSMPLADDESSTDEDREALPMKVSVTLSPKSSSKHAHKAARLFPKLSMPLEDEYSTDEDREALPMKVSVTLSPKSSPKHAHKAARLSPKLSMPLADDESSTNKEDKEALPMKVSVTMSPKSSPKQVYKTPRLSPKLSLPLEDESSTDEEDRETLPTTVSVTLSPKSSPKQVHKTARLSPKLSCHWRKNPPPMKTKKP